MQRSSAKLKKFAVKTSGTGKLNQYNINFYQWGKMTELRKLQIELEFDWENENYKNNNTSTLVEIFGYPLTEDIHNIEVIGGIHGADREIFLLEVAVNEKVFSDFSKAYGVFLENYFGHITLPDFAVKRLAVQDSQVVKKRLQDFLADFSWDLENKVR